MASEELQREIDAGEGIALRRLLTSIPSVRLNRPPTYSRVLRWALRGIHVAGRDDRLRLEAVRIAGHWITTAAAYRRFVAAQTPGALPPPPTSPAQIRTAAQRASRELAEMGV